MVNGCICLSSSCFYNFFFFVTMLNFITLFKFETELQKKQGVENVRTETKHQFNLSYTRPKLQARQQYQRLHQTQHKTLAAKFGTTFNPRTEPVNLAILGDQFLMIGSSKTAGERPSYRHPP